MKMVLDARYVRERPSGIGAYVEALARHLPALLPEASITLWAHPRANAVPLRDNTRTVVVRAEANGPRTLLWPRSLAALDDADVFHSPANILGRGIRAAKVVTIHDVMWLTAPALCEAPSLAFPFRRAFYADGLRRAFREATRIVAVSKTTASGIASVAPWAKARVVVIPHGVDGRFRPAADEAHARARAACILGSEEPYFLAIGQRAPFKNHGAVLEAFAASTLVDTHRLVVIERSGPGPTSASRAAALGIAHRITVLSEQSLDDIVDVLRGALGLCQFSRFEGFGLPLLEAMASGTPVLASDTPALVEVAGGAALHVPLSPALLARVMAQLAGSPGLAEELRGRGLERARAFSWDRSAKAHAEVYLEAFAAGARAG